MPTTIRIAHREHVPAGRPHQSPLPPLCPDDSPAAVTPQEIGPEHASWADRRERGVHSDDLDLREEALLDEAIELSFPASDPSAELPLQTSSHCFDADERMLDEAIELTFPASDPVAFTPLHRLVKP